MLADPAPLDMLYFDRPPFLVEQGGTVGGAIGDRVSAAARQAGIPLNWVPLPNMRLWRTLQSNARACSAAWFLTPARQRDLKPTTPIWLDTPLVLLMPSSGPEALRRLPIRRLLADPKVRVVLKDGFSYGVTLDDWLDGAAANLMRVSPDLVSIGTMIGMERGDLTILPQEEALEVVARAAGAVTLVRPPDMPRGEWRYILCSLAVEDGVVARLSQAIDTLYADKTARH